jgi:hypothetical protein
MWELDTSQMVRNFTWWWWWWIVFLDPPAKDLNPRQLMILWSTKNCDRIWVNDHHWRRKERIAETDDGYRFHGMTAAWYYDGEHMHDPLVLEDNQFRVLRKGPKREAEGQLLPRSSHDLSLSGKRDSYRLNIVNDEVDFRFKFTPLNEFMTTHRYHANKYTGKWGYNIHKIYGMKADARLGVTGEGDPSGRPGYHPIRPGAGKGKTEKAEGTAYFQKLMVNAPAVPWMWGIFHMDDGSFLDYMVPHIGMPMFRRSPGARSPLDRGAARLSQKMVFYDAQRDETHQLTRIKIRRTYHKGPGHGNKEEPLPTFHVTASDPSGKELSLELRSYSRAYWRFQQPWLGFIPTVFYYNEYPVHMTGFRYKDGTGHLISRDRWKKVHGNCEYSWGLLL